MNRNCNGDFFKVKGKQLYCCFLDSAVVANAESGKPCPNCKRQIEAAADAGECKTKTEEFVVIPGRGRIPLSPNGECSDAR
jgi:hypothetical protein